MFVQDLGRYFSNQFRSGSKKYEDGLREAATRIHFPEDGGRNISGPEAVSPEFDSLFSLGDFPESSVVLKSPEGIFRMVGFPWRTKINEELPKAFLDIGER